MIQSKIKNSLKLELNNSIKVKKSLLELNDKIEIVIDKISNSLEKKGKIFFCGNGDICSRIIDILE